MQAGLSVVGTLFIQLLVLYVGAVQTFMNVAPDASVYAVMGVAGRALFVLSFVLSLASVLASLAVSFEVYLIQSKLIRQGMKRRHELEEKAKIKYAEERAARRKQQS